MIYTSSKLRLRLRGRENMEDILATENRAQLALITTYI